LVTPIFIPWVCALPELDTIFNTPSNNFNSMSTELWTSDVLIDSCLIWDKIFINCKSTFNGSISEDFGHDLLFVVGKWEWVGSWNFISSIFSFGFRVAWFSTLWCWFGFTAWFILTGSVMITRGKRVWFTPVLISKKMASNQTLVLEVSPSTSWETTIASHTTSKSTTCQQVFSWDSGLKSLLGLDTDSVTHSFSSSEGPTRSTSWLVSNFFDTVTSWPLFSWVEVIRESDHRFNIFQR